MPNRQTNEGELESKISADSQPFIELMDAAGSDSPKGRLEAVIGKYSDKPYAKDVLSKARVMLCFRKYYDRKKRKS